MVIGLAEKDLLNCMKRELKDNWVTMNEVATTCSKAGGQTRKYLENLASEKMVEKDQKCCVCYRVDPPNWPAIVTMTTLSISLVLGIWLTNRKMHTT